MIAQKTKLLLLGFLLCSATSMAQEKLYFGQTEIGFLYGRGAEQWDGNHERRIDISFMTFNGVHITKSQVVGFTIGLDQYDDISIIPFALGWRGFLGKESKPKIFGGFDIGGGSAILEKKESNEWSKSWYEGGLMYSPSVGISFPALKGNSSFSFSLAYKRQNITYFQGSLLQSGSPTIASDLLPPGFSSMNENNYIYRSFVARVGLMF
ncbi:hypothetical protein [Algoriphagus chordae]|uniref:Outer membrane protein with beta-barrel domain n=1 Tax=Algoriphagus chordae TaxID=237019 RepID=A0A2W7RMH3_9BACT|nr:hypothetical protein [Algoriphagus chordae]PZX55729.1 hypothetical protein LV85_00954 [Algoriphagus chordae]